MCYTIDSEREHKGASPMKKRSTTMKKSLKIVRMHWSMYNELYTNRCAEGKKYRYTQEWVRNGNDVVCELYNYRTNIETGEKERVQVRCVFQ